MNLYKYLESAAADAPDKLFLVKQGASYAAFMKLVRARAATIAARGIVAGDVVGILARNIPEYVISAFAIWFLGGRVLLLDNKLTNGDYEKMSAAANAKLVLAENQFIFDSPGIKFADIEKSDDDDGGNLKPHDTDGAEIASLSFTSGSTGTPKIVPLTHDNLIAAANGLEDLHDFVGRGDDFLLFLPLYHIFGLAFITLHAMHYRGGIILETSSNPREIIKNFRIYKPRVVPAVPRIWEIIKNMIVDLYKEKGSWNFAKFVLRHQKFFNAIGLKQMVRQVQWPVHEMFGRTQVSAIGGGAAVKTDVMKFFEWFGFDFLQGYGLTEGSGPNTVSLPHRHRVIGSVGKPLTPNEFEIRSRDRDGIGALCLRGPMIFHGYLNNPDATADALDKNGWLNTGDLASVDKNGEIHIHGRAKNIIVLDSGKNVYPDELEAHYIKIEGVKNVLVIERVLNGKTVAYGLFQVEPGVALDDLSARIAAMNAGIGSYKRVVNFAMTTEDFPLTSSGKNKHFEAKKLLEQGKYPLRKE
ncbi:MAG: AMP-binding protein [Rickettsiales bacterium]|jgi:long-chain acyl-CoA synthetase|nr:AMP-binding protein [Rickettsiales bacterium]